MRWLEVGLVVETELVEPVADLLFRHSPGGIAIQPEPIDAGPLDAASQLRVAAYLPEDPYLPTRLRDLEEGLWHLGRIRPLPALDRRWVEQRDWAETWKVHFWSIEVGRRLLILPPWLELPPGDRRIAIRIDPGMAFGTGTHPSTQLALALLEDHIAPGATVIDIGTGSAILSIAAALLGAGAVLGMDIDPTAIESARGNLRRHRLGDRVRIELGSLPELLRGDLPDYVPCRIVVANILAGTLSEMLDSGLDRLVEPGGLAILAGILVDHASEVQQAARRNGWRPAGERRSGEWVALVLKKPAAPSRGRPVRSLA